MRTICAAIVAAIAASAAIGQPPRRAVAIVVAGGTVITENAARQIAAPEMIESGTTTFADMYYFEEEIARAAFEAGLRGILGQTIIQFPVADAKTPADALARAERFIREFKDNGLVVPAVAPHALYTNDKT